MAVHYALAGVVDLDFDNVEIAGPLDIQLTAKKGRSLLCGVELIRLE